MKQVEQINQPTNQWINQTIKQSSNDLADLTINDIITAELEGINMHRWLTLSLSFVGRSFREICSSRKGFIQWARFTRSGLLLLATAFLLAVTVNHRGSGSLEGTASSGNNGERGEIRQTGRLSALAGPQFGRPGGWWRKNSRGRW